MPFTEHVNRIESSRNRLSQAFQQYYNQPRLNNQAFFVIDTHIHTASEKEYYENLATNTYTHDNYEIWADIIVKNTDIWTDILLQELKRNKTEFP